MDNDSGYRYDFQKLKKNESYTISRDNVILELQLCEALSRDCDGESDFSMCLTKNKTEIGLGKSLALSQIRLFIVTKIFFFFVGREPPDIQVENGEIMFKYNGKKCNDNNDVNYSVNIKMMCDFVVKSIEFSAADTVIDHNSTKTFNIKFCYLKKKKKNSCRTSVYLI